MTIRTSVNILFIITLLMTAFSCKKFVVVDPPQNEIIGTAVFQDDVTAVSAITGLYTQMMNSNLFFANGAFSVCTALSGDEIYNTAASATYDPFLKNAIPVNNSKNSNDIWRWGFNYIYQANAILEGVAASGQMTKAAKDQLTGEALVARALCYFYLVNTYGTVPLIISTDYEKNAIQTQVPAASSYDQIINDLKTAADLLSTSYVTAGKVRPNKWTAVALLARTYLYTKDWVNAELQSSRLLDTGSPYHLVSNLSNVFLAGSDEAIWQLMPTNPSFNTGEGSVFVPTSSTVKPTFALTSYLSDAFDAQDKRVAAWLGVNTVSGIRYYYPYKYKIKSIALNGSVTEYNMVLRLAEQYLIRAEARAALGKTAAAVTDLDSIRARAGVPLLKNTKPGIGQADLQLAIEQERRLELFCEWGHRWFDLKRTGRIDAVLKTEKTTWTPAAALYPVPSTDILSNPFLVPTPGYIY